MSLAVTSRRQHIVDELIEERAENLMRHPLAWKFVKTYLYPLLGYRKAIEMVDEVQSMTGKEIFNHLSATLSMRVEVEGLEHIPQEGLSIIMPNHPAGIADGIAVYDALKGVRDDLIFFANRDAVRAAPQLEEMIIPVEWMESRRDHARSKETVRTMLRAFREERLVVIFSSGRLARPTLSGLVERPWLSSGVGLAQKYECPVIPMNVRGHNSLLYYFFWFVNEELKDMTLFRELLNKKNQRYRMRIAEPFRPKGDPELIAHQLREFVTIDMRKGNTRFEFR